MAQGRWSWRASSRAAWTSVRHGAFAASCPGAAVRIARPASNVIIASLLLGPVSEESNGARRESLQELPSEKSWRRSATAQPQESDQDRRFQPRRAAEMTAPAPGVGWDSACAAAVRTRRHGVVDHREAE